MPGCNEKEKASDLPLAFSFYFASLSSDYVHQLRLEIHQNHFPYQASSDRYL